MPDISHSLAGRDDAVLLVRVPAELNHESAEALRMCVVRSMPNRDGAGVVLDFEVVSLVSSIGIAALLQILEFCRDRGAGLVLASVPARQAGFLKMLKLDGKFEMAPTVDEAVARVSAHG